MKTTLLLLAILSLFLFTATNPDKPYGPIIVANDLVTVASGNSISGATLYTPTVDGAYNVYFFANQAACPSPGGAEVDATDVSTGTTHSIGTGAWWLHGGSPITYNVTGPCEILLEVEKL
jgi:hypothetical protein